MNNYFFKSRITFWKVTFTSFLLLFITDSVVAQNAVIPMASPKAEIMQTIGVNEVRVNYSRPSVRKRQVFGSLVPFGKVWRIGANEATTITLRYAVQINGDNIPAGKYALFMVPKNNNEWVLILNSEWDQWGAYLYNSEKDIARIAFKPATSGFTEQLTIAFEEVSKSSARLEIRWDTTLMAVNMVTESHSNTLEEIEMASKKAQYYWMSFSAAAQYHYYERKEYTIALAYLEKAIALDAPNPSPWMLKSQILAEQGKYKEAIAVAKEAIRICGITNHPFEIRENKENIAQWEKEL